MRTRAVHPAAETTLHRRLRVAFVVAAAGAAGAAAGGARAAENPFERGVEDRFGISVGAFIVTLNTGIRLDAADGSTGTDIDLDKDLGFETGRTTGRIDAYWRLAPRHRIDLSAFLLRRTADRELSREIVWGDVTYDVGARISARAQNDVIKLAYKYSFVRNDRFELCGSIGVSTWIVSTRLEGQGTITTSEGTVLSERAQESKDITAPVPVIGLLGEWRVARGWFLRGSAEYVEAHVGESEGSFGDYRLDLNWFPFERWGFGVGYNWVDLTYKDVGRPQVDADLGFDGALAYVSYVF